MGRGYQEKRIRIRGGFTRLLAEFVWVSKLLRPPWYAVFTPARFSPHGVLLAEPIALRFGIPGPHTA